MNDLAVIVQGLRRPRLLVQAARHGLGDYKRSRVLQRLVRLGGSPGPQRAVNALLPVEAHLEQARKSGDASYNPARHVEVLIALLGEVRLLSGDRSANERRAPRKVRVA